MTSPTAPLALVWGNCQAPALARLLAPPLAAHGLEVLEVPPVHLLTPAQLGRVRGLLPRVRAFVSQPIRDEYATPGCGTAQLAAQLPRSAVVLRVASCFDVAAFPWSANAHGGDGVRVDAPLTAYHDLRVLLGAHRGWSRDRILAEWDSGDALVEAIAGASWRELRRRELTVDVPVSPWIRRPGALFTMNHPANATLQQVADAVLAALGVAGRTEPPDREMLGATRLPVEAGPARLLGWAASGPAYVVDGRPVDLGDVVDAHLASYARRPDVVADAAGRFAGRWQPLAAV